MSKVKLIPVVVTTEWRGVFFGYLAGGAVGKDRKATLTKARNCLYWPASVGGFMGLATCGPMEGAKLGRQVPTVMLEGVTAVIPCSADAEALWLK